MMTPDMSAQLSGKVAFITGAGRGIGRGIALVLAERGALVALSDLDEKGPRDVLDEVRERGGDGISGIVDVTKPESIRSFVAEIIRKYRQLDICVANAGVVGGPGFQERFNYADEDWELTNSVNVRGLVNTADAVVDHMKENRAGKFIAIASQGGRPPRGLPEPGRGTIQIPYLVSKAAAIQWTHHLAIQLGQYGINVNAVCPGLLWTPIWEEIAENHRIYNPELKDLTQREIFDEIVRRRTPLGVAQTPEDIGKAVAFLASDDAAQITGQALNVNGGAIMN